MNGARTRGVVACANELVLLSVPGSAGDWDGIPRGKVRVNDVVEVHQRCGAVDSDAIEGGSLSVPVGRRLDGIADDGALTIWRHLVVVCIFMKYVWGMIPISCHLVFR